MYEQLCEELDWPVDADRLAKLRSANEEKLTAFDAKIADAEENLGDVEVREARAAKAFYLCKTGEAIGRGNRLRFACSSVYPQSYYLVECMEVMSTLFGNLHRHLIRFPNFHNRHGGTL